MLRWAFNFLLAGFLVAIFAVAVIAWYVVPGLPEVEVLRDVRLQVPLRVYTRDGVLIGEFGEKRRNPVRLEEVPDIVIKAFLDAEDDRFYDHPGVDWQGIIRAIGAELRHGDRAQGGSTITQQVARAYFLSPEKTYTRKLREILLALKIERQLSKDEILALYLNTIFLGQRAYGIGAAAQVYYGKELSELTLDEVATLAGIPPAPSAYNPVASPSEAHKRRSYVLRRLLEKRHISREQFDVAMRAPIQARVHVQELGTEAPDMAEMARQFMNEKFGEEAATTSGFRVYTTIDSRLQTAANRSLRDALMAYDRRHGYRGPERHADLAPDAGETAWRAALQGVPAVGGLLPAIVTAVTDKAVDVYTPIRGSVRIEWNGLSWAAPYIDSDRRGAPPRKAGDILAVGDIVRIRQVAAETEEADKRIAGKRETESTTGPAMVWKLAQVPAVQGALVSLDAGDGAILALVGGFDFHQSKFNRVTQAYRQPGSNFKPFLYSAALEAGFTPASLINDAPIVFDAPGLDATWRPENYSREYLGPTRLREALSASRNLVSIRLLGAVGIDFTADFAKRFGFVEERLPRDLSLALGTGVATPLEIARAYGVFANGGYLLDPYFIERVETGAGQLLMRADPPRVCRSCEAAPLAVAADGAAAAAVRAADRPTRTAPRVISAENAWMMNSMMQDVIRSGTARRALALKRNDIAGKTGTTNEQRDAWFSGFNSHVVTTTWVGFDQSLPLGKDETGARVALPMWIDYMRVALGGLEEVPLPQPRDLVTVRIDPDTGTVAGSGDEDAVFETFRSDEVPARASPERTSPAAAGGATMTPEDLF